MMRTLLLHVLLFIFIPVSLFAQTTQASIYGRVVDNQGKILPGATVQLRNESTGFTTKTSTSQKGEYSFQELPLGGPYQVHVLYVGLGEQLLKGYTLNQGDGIRVDVQLFERSQQLDVVTITAGGMKNKIENLGAATAISAKEMTTLPVNGRNFTSLMELSPLSSGGGSLAGQLGSSTNYTIDGMSAKNPTSAGATTSRSGAPYSISMEAVREFKVVTNQYDVTFGRAGGGTVSAVTKSGTNTLSGSAWNYMRADWLSSPYNIAGGKRKNEFSTNQYGFTLGGPIIKDKVHFFVAWDHQRDARPLIIADIQSAADEARFNITNATLDNLVGIAQSNYGMAGGAQYGSFPKKRNSDAAFARIDWQINERNLLTIRNNYTNDRNNLGLEDNTRINLYESYANDKNIDNSLLATLRTSISPKLTNELKVQHLYTYQLSSPGDQLPAANIPRAIINGVTSTVGASNLATNVQFGGHRFAQEGFTNNVLQLVNNLYYNTEKVKYVFGVDVMHTKAKSLYGSEVNGRFTFGASQQYSALENLAAQRAQTFYREVPLVADPTVHASIVNAGLYGQLQTNLAKGLEMTAGLRLDYGFYPKSPLNQDLLDALGVRTDYRLQSFVVQPRVQFTWNVNDKHKDFIRFGAGVFASDINNYMTINNLTFDGKHFATVDVRGADVPKPDFLAYRKDPNSIPTLAAHQVPTINTYAEDAKIPVIYKANLSYSHFFTNKFRVGIAGYMTLARNNYMYEDRNMVADPFFRLANEGQRGVYVPVDAIVDGVADWKAGRISEKFGRVLTLNSKGKLNQFAVVLDASYQYYKDGVITASYTWNDARDNTSFNGNVANSATLSLAVKDDPRDLSTMSYSNGQFRNKVVFFGTLPSFYGVQVGLRYTGIGGTRYSLLSGGNTNGDFVAGNNDLAFIFDSNAASTPDALASSLKALLANPEASESLKRYIRRYEGQIAERNGGINKFYGILDIRVAKKFAVYKTHSLEVSADIFNLANLFNKDWGTNHSLSSQALYELGGAAGVPRFDAQRAQYNYRLNNTGIANPSGNPYQFQLGLRYGF
ncbi:TonB-dependent receptor [Rhinopithecimicrobium faecis]